MVPVNIDPTSPTFKKYVKYAIFLIIGLLLVANMYIFYKNLHSGDLPEVKEIPAVTTEDVKKGIQEGTGKNLSNKDAGEVVDKIQYRVQYTEPDYKTRVSSESEGDKVAQLKGKADGADVVLKEKKPTSNTAKAGDSKSNESSADDGKQDLYYYGINMEKKRHAIGVYKGIGSDFSMGVHYRNDKIVIEVGKDTNGGVDARLAYEAFQW